MKLIPRTRIPEILRNRKERMRKWSNAEDAALLCLQELLLSDWFLIASILGRSAHLCADRYVTLKRAHEAAREYLDAKKRRKLNPPPQKNEVSEVVRRALMTLPLKKRVIVLPVRDVPVAAYTKSKLSPVINPC